MKKILVIMLVLILALGAAALAENPTSGTTSITYTATTVDTYSVTIPSSASISSTTTTFDVSITPQNGYNLDKTIAIKLSDTALTDGLLALTDTASNTIHMAFKNGTTALSNGDTVVSVNAFGSDGTATTGTITTEISDVTGDKLIGGNEYSGTLNFTVSVSDTQ